MGNKTRSAGENMREKDKGFSLIELIVVIAIMAVALGVGSYSLSAISLANAKECATEIKSTLEAARMETVRSASNPGVQIYRGTDGVYMQAGNNAAKKIGSSGVTVKYQEGSEWKELGQGTANALKFVFDKSTGGFSTFGTNKIVVSSAGKEYTITCYKLTGKVEME